jgi:hypothetical protein
MVDNDPGIPAQAIRDGVRISPYVPGGQGTAVATFLAGKAPLAAPGAVGETEFVEGSGVASNTVPPNDFGYWGVIDSLMQQEPAGAGDPELLGLLAAVGIVKGKPFDPNARMREILEEAASGGDLRIGDVVLSCWSVLPGALGAAHVRTIRARRARSDQAPLRAVRAGGCPYW